MREDIFNTNNLRKNKDKDLLNKVKKSKVTTNNFLRYNIVTVSSIDDLYLLNLNKEKVCVSREKDGIFMYRIKDNTLYYIPIDLISEFNELNSNNKTINYSFLSEEPEFIKNISNNENRYLHSEKSSL